MANTSELYGAPLTAAEAEKLHAQAFFTQKEKQDYIAALRSGKATASKVSSTTIVAPTPAQATKSGNLVAEKTPKSSGLVTGSVEYANQALRSKKIETLDSRRTNATGQPSQKDLLRQPGVEDVIPKSMPANQLGDESVMILSARGTFYLVKLASTYGPGIYAIDELTRSVLAPDFTGPVQDRPGETNSPILLTSIEFNQTDITSQVPCLNNVKVFYSFGQNFGQVVISGEVLLGPLGNLSYDGVNRLVGFFWKHRVSVLKKPIAVSVANNSYFVYLTGLRIGQVNADFHILPFVMFGTLLDIEREKADEVNTSGTVITEGSLDEPSLFAALTAPISSPTNTSGKKTSEAAAASGTVKSGWEDPGETEPKISAQKDPSLNAAKGSAATADNTAGDETAAKVTSGNGTATAIAAKLTAAPETQADKDIAALKADLVKSRNDYLASAPKKAAFGKDEFNQMSASTTAYDKSVERTQSAIRGANAIKAQEANLAAGKKVQELSMAEQQDIMVYQAVMREKQAVPGV